MAKPEIIEEYLNKNIYTVEIWDQNDALEELVQLSYKVVIAFQDFSYLDYGYWGKSNYHNWKMIYDNKMPSVDNSNLLLGAEIRI